MNRRVLLIDADPAFRDTLTKELGRYRVVVMCEPEADRALQLGLADPPDLLVIGVEEPEKAGFRAFQKAKKGALAKTPVVLVTSSVPPDSFAKHKGLKVHADEYIDKRSMTSEELIAKIDNLIGLGDLQEDELGVAVDDDIPMELADGDVVLDETVGEDEEADQFNERTVGPGTGVRADSMIAAETDAAFDALMGDEPSAMAAPVPVADEDSAVPEPVPHPSAPEPVEDEISAVPEPVPHPSRPDSGAYPEQDAELGGNTFMGEEAVAQVEEERIEAPDRMQSQPAIPLEDEELVPMEDELAVEAAPEPKAPEPAKPAEEATVAREPIVAEGARKSGGHPMVDLGLDAIAQDADREQSGVYDRKALRKISDLERQITQLKQEVERARAQADTAAKGGGRETQFLKLREQLDSKDKELKQTKNELVTIGGKVAELEKKLEQVQHTKDKLDAKNKELEQRIFESGDRTKDLEAEAQKAKELAAKLTDALGAKTEELEAAQRAHAEELQALRVELTENFATAGEDSVRAALAESEKKHQKDLISLKADQAGELKRVRNELGGELARTKEELGGKVAALESELVRVKQQHEAELAARDEEHEEARERDAQSHGQALGQLKQELDHARASHEAAIAEAKGELEEVVAQHEEHKSQLHEQHRAELAAAAQKHAQELAAAAQKHAQELAAQAEQHAQAHAAQAQEHAQAQEAQAAEHAEAMSAARAERDEMFDAAERAAEAHRAALAETKSTYESQIAETRELAAREAAEHRAQIAAAKRHAEETAARAEQEREALEQEHARQLADQEAKHERAIAVANGDFLKQKSVADAEHARAIAALKAEADRKIAELEAETEELRRGLSGARDTLKRTESELQSAMETIAERNDELRAHQAAIAERDTRLADLRKEIEALLQENTSYQDQVLRAYQKIKSDEAMVARARKAMAIALTVLDDDGNPSAQS